MITTTLPALNTCTVAVIGLGYVGLPLAVAFGKPQVCRRTGNTLLHRVIGFDINSQRLEDLRHGIDYTNETSTEELQAAQLLEFTSDPSQLAEADVFVVTVPTPIDSAKRPDLSPLEKASATVGRALKDRSSPTMAVVIYESTVYPGATEDRCVPILERESGLAFNESFCCGYSPERINPGDNEHKLSTIVKVTSGSTVQAAAWVDDLYGSIIEAGTHLAPSIKVAEAAKVIENTQRDLNIALVNELAIIFRMMRIDTLDVLEAAGTKWNFLPFRPGLVGGHCIGVDPYYLTHKAEELGYHPQVVLAGRRINDMMAKHLGEQFIFAMLKANLVLSECNILILGITFKEDCPDIRNTKIVDLISVLSEYCLCIDICDPCADVAQVSQEFNLQVYNTIADKTYDAIFVAIAHQQFCRFTTAEWRQLINENGIIYDLKGIVPRSLSPIRP